MTTVDGNYRPALADGELVGGAALVWLAALVAAPVPIAPAALATVVAFVARRRALFVVGLALVASGLGHRAVQDFQPRSPAPFHGEVVVIAEASRAGVGWRAIVRLPDGDRVEALGFGRSGIELRRAGAGSTLVVHGRLSPIGDTGWARARHLVGRLSVSAVDRWGPPTGVRATVEAVRSAIVDGADPLSHEQQPLYLGLVIGEDRMQGAAQRARFRAAGLSHLLAVSGQNVAFVLAIATPITRTIGLRGRVLFTIGLLVVFAVVTRFEPSVLRATVTAGLATVTSLSGHERDGVRLLSLAVISLVLADPFLVHAVGFQLSVAASAGILVLAPGVASRLPGPMMLRQATAVTVAAQVAVLPLQLHYFGPVSAASVPANVLAGWAAGIVMAWGLSVGVVAGIAPTGVARWIQAPAAWLLVWLDQVAAVAARAPAPMITVPVVMMGAALVALRRLGSAHLSSHPLARRVLTGSMGALLLAMALAAVPEAPDRPTSLRGGGSWFPGDVGAPSVLVVAANADDRLVDEMAARRLTRVDLVVSEAGTGAGSLVTAAVAELVEHEVVLAPAQHRIVGAHRVKGRVVIETGDGRLVVEPEANRLAVTHEMSAN